MSSLVISGAGALIGAFIGGPTGAQIGWALGATYAASQETIDQREIGDLKVQTSSYGSAIPYVIGKQRLAGNIIWAEDKKTHDVESGGKGGPSVVQTGYSISMLIGICAGPILGVSRVWADGDLIIDSRETSKKLIGQLYLGDSTQLADPTYQAAVGADAPAYRGLAYISLTDYDLGLTGRIPQFSFEVVRGSSM